MRSNGMIEPQFLYVHDRILSLSGTGRGDLNEEWVSLGLPLLGR